MILILKTFLFAIPEKTGDMEYTLEQGKDSPKDLAWAD